MTAEAIIGAAVGATVLVGFAGRGLWALHKLLGLGERIIIRVDALERKLSNGIEAKITSAEQKAQEACRLAGVAATTASRIEQQATDNYRATNALRGDVDIL